MTKIAAGTNVPISQKNISLDLCTAVGSDVNFNALQLYADGKVRGDEDICSINQMTIGAGAVTFNVVGSRNSFYVDFESVHSDVAKIVINASLKSGQFSKIHDLTVMSSDNVEIVVDTSVRSESALIICELYKRADKWKIRNVSQGFNGGLVALAEHFGVNSSTLIEPARPAKPVKQPKSQDTKSKNNSGTDGNSLISLSKVSLTKSESTISLRKDDGKFGRIRVNLNWNQKQKKSGFFGTKRTNVDLDLGAFFEFKEAGKGVVQALGNSFGDFEKPPFIKLMADDRTGASSDGEWLEINGDAWPYLHRIMIFAFIYDGAANWKETDGIVRVIVPGQPEVEVKMNEFSSNSGNRMCAVATLQNTNNQIMVSRQVKFFPGHRELDKAFNWGFSWRAGSK